LRPSLCEGGFDSDEARPLNWFVLLFAGLVLVGLGAVLAVRPADGATLGHNHPLAQQDLG